MLFLRGAGRVCYFTCPGQTEIILGPCIIEILEDLCMYWKVCLEMAVNTYERLLPIFLKPPAWTVGSLPHVSPGKPFIILG